LFFRQPGEEAVGKQFLFKVFGDPKGGSYTYAEVKEKKSIEEKQKKNPKAKEKKSPARKQP
jgi:hypothetical protein